MSKNKKCDISTNLSKGVRSREKHYHLNELNRSRTRSHILEKCLNASVSKRIGGGSEGTVYLGKFDNGIVAIKEIFKHLDKFDELNKEIDIGYLLSKDGLGPKIYDTFYVVSDKKNVIQYIVMEYLPVSIEKIFQGNDRDLMSDVSNRIIKLISGLVYKSKVFCMDLKPDNMMMSEDGVVKLVDFGFTYDANEMKTGNSGKNKLDFLYMTSLLIFLMRSQHPPPEFIQEIDKYFTKYKKQLADFINTNEQLYDTVFGSYVVMMDGASVDALDKLYKLVKGF